jgi:hypothetical protein
LKLGAGRGLAENATDETADERSCHAKHSGHQETEVRVTRHDETGDRTDDNTDNEHPYILHGKTLPGW